MIFTIIDSFGEPYSKVTMPDADNLHEVIPIGYSFVSGEPPVWESYYQNGEWVQKPENPDPTFTWNPVTKIWEDTRTLEQARTDKWTSTKGIRDSIMYGGFLYNGKSFDSDPIAQGRITGAFALASNPDTANVAFPKLWKLADNSAILISASDMIAIGVTLNAMIQNCIDIGDTLLTQINTAPLTELDNITWPTTS